MHNQKGILAFLFITCYLLSVMDVFSQPSVGRNSNYVSNREPLVPNPYVQLPFDAITPKGWLHQQLKLSADGMTGHLDEIWKDVGPNNGWLGGKGDSWERGPYWLDGLIPLAYILKDKALIQKAQRWIEWSLTHQREDGYFGPELDPTRIFTPEERVLAWQEKNKEDWWPHMVMLKVMEQYYDATQDKRVLNFMTKYFKYQQKHLPTKPLAHWTHWAKSRGGENLASIYWLYNRTGEPFLLELAQLIFQQTEEWTKLFEDGDPRYWHGVNTGMGIKQPAVWYQQSKDERFLKAVKKGINDLMKYHGQVQGMFSGDELLHGTDPTQGTEFCTVVEYMFSLESLIKITGDLEYADKLERLAFNALPTQATPHFTSRQYFQLPNQISCDTRYHNFNVNYSDAILFGLETGYGCCTANYHQGWPKFAAHLWLATQDNGLAALEYAPSEVTAKVANNIEVTFIEETNYPFDETITFTFASSHDVQFPLHVRIPAWCNSAKVLVNGKEFSTPKAGSIERIARVWKKRDKVELHLPMEVQLSKWHEEAIGVERGPLVYALRMKEEWKKVKGNEPYATYEVTSNDSWNYGLLIQDLKNPSTSFQVIKGEMSLQPWKIDSAPIQLKVKAKRIPEWQQYGGIAGPLPWSPVKSKESIEDITLIPYGCTKLRISEFPSVE
ncbi:MAG: glycoside hydrolase family 127 protein [Ignavibacteriales bacterium]|nr:glycoside hydrolase family 127 protein [Ignavibacteriales bacterium]